MCKAEIHKVNKISKISIEAQCINAVVASKSAVNASDLVQHLKSCENHHKRETIEVLMVSENCYKDTLCILLLSTAHMLCALQHVIKCFS